MQCLSGNQPIKYITCPVQGERSPDHFIEITTTYFQWHQLAQRSQNGIRIQIIAANFKQILEFQSHHRRNDASPILDHGSGSSGQFLESALVEPDHYMGIEVN